MTPTSWSSDGDAKNAARLGTFDAMMRWMSVGYVALADVAIGSAGNMYIPAASLGSRRTLLPLPFEHRAGCRRESPHCEGALTRLTTPWPAWPQHSM